MKAITILNKIEKEQVCSIHTAELLTKALHREGKLNENQVVRFSPLHRKFDIVNADFFTTGKFNRELCSDCWFSIKELKSYLLTGEALYEF